MTTGQMVQFVLVMAQAIYHLLPHNVDRYWPLSQPIGTFLLMVQMLWMFGDFFVTTFCKRPADGRKSKAAAGDDAAGVAPSAGSEAAAKSSSEGTVTAAAAASTEGGGPAPSSGSKRRAVSRRNEA